MHNDALQNPKQAVFLKKPRTNLYSTMLAISLGISTITSLALPTQQAQAQVVTTDFSSLVSRLTPSVARVNVTKKISGEELAQAQQAELLRQFFGNRIQIPENQRTPAVEHAYGTGFFVTSDGYMLTNHHVIEDADTITVTLNDRTELDATLVGSDERSDIAVLKITGSNFPALSIGQSANVKVGEPVLAIGSPFGFDYSASAGIVSAKSRNFSRQTSVPFIQTDVALNPGNSGGPLFNIKGEVIGINSRIFSRTGGYMGLSFSIPIDDAMDVYQQLITNGEVKHAYLGIYPQNIDRNLAEAYGLEKPQGALLTRVSEDSPAQKAGLKAGDIILKYNNQKILSADELLNLLNRAQPQDNFSVLIQRDGRLLTKTGQLSSSATNDPSKNSEADKGIKLGLRLRELTPEELSELTNYGIDGGLLITAVDPIGLAARSGLQAGDLITNLNGSSVTSVTEFAGAIQTLPEDGVVTLAFFRNGIPAILGLRIENE